MDTRIKKNSDSISTIQNNLDSVNAQLTGNWIAVGAQFLIYEGQLIALFSTTAGLTTTVATLSAGLLALEA